MTICIIPARGGSKRIAKKNIKLFAGKPMIAWSIRAAINAKCFDRIIVSTDDEEIADVSLKYGAEAPFIRGTAISGDYTPVYDVIKDVILRLDDGGSSFDKVCCLYATAPLLHERYITEGLEMLGSQKCSYVFGIAKFDYPIQRALKKNSLGNIQMFTPEKFYSRSQDLESAYHDSGQFYWASKSEWLTQPFTFNEQSKGVDIPAEYVQDIDTPEDWTVAEYKFNLLKTKTTSSEV
jgi:N-acylneuraminate cytidylyltransferase